MSALTTAVSIVLVAVIGLVGAQLQTRESRARLRKDIELRDLLPEGPARNQLDALIAFKINALYGQEVAGVILTRSRRLAHLALVLAIVGAFASGTLEVVTIEHKLRRLLEFANYAFVALVGVLLLMSLWSLREDRAALRSHYARLRRATRANRSPEPRTDSADPADGASPSDSDEPGPPRPES